MEDREVGTIAATQHGIITRDQANGCGLTNRQVGSRVAAGRWSVVRPGVYVIAGAPPSFEQAVLAACLACDALASHLTAAQLWGLGFPSPERIDVVTPRRHPEHSGVHGHRSATLHPSDSTFLRAVPITSSARTLVDIAGTVRPERLGGLVRDAMRRGVVGLADLRACHQRIDTGSGRRPTLALREVLADLEPDALGDSERELHLVQVIAAAGLPAPVLGHALLAGGRPYLLDLAWPTAMVAVEFDGWAFHKGFVAFHADRQRTRHLVAAGWTIVPATAKTPDWELIRDLRSLLCGAPTTVDVVNPPLNRG